MNPMVESANITNKNKQKFFVVFQRGFSSTKNAKPRPNGFTNYELFMFGTSFHIQDSIVANKGSRLGLPIPKKCNNLGGNWNPGW